MDDYPSTAFMRALLCHTFDVKGGETMTGIARNTQENRDFLAACPAVESQSQDGDMIQFRYDPSKQPLEVPEGVYFDLSLSPF